MDAKAGSYMFEVDRRIMNSYPADVLKNQIGSVLGGQQGPKVQFETPNVGERRNALVASGSNGCVIRLFITSDGP